jgi:hypothetical protein
MRQPYHQNKANAQRLEEEEICVCPNQIIPVHPIHIDSSNRITRCDLTHVHAISYFLHFSIKEYRFFFILGDDDSSVWICHIYIYGVWVCGVTRTSEFTNQSTNYLDCCVVWICRYIYRV